MDFYTIVVLIAIVLLVLGLTIIGMTLAKRNSTNPFPEYQTSCPDFWTLNDKGLCVPSPLNTPSPSKYYKLVDIKHNGIVFDNIAKPANIVSLDPSENSWTSTCDKTKWATNNGILWDGISNYNGCTK